MSKRDWKMFLLGWSPGAFGAMIGTTLLFVH